MARSKISQKLQPWLEARRRFKLSHAHIQMARELGMNPRKFGSLANHKQQPWKAPLPVFIEDLYEERFGRSRPEQILSLEELSRQRDRKKQLRREERQGKRESNV